MTETIALRLSKRRRTEEYHVGYSASRRMQQKPSRWTHLQGRVVLVPRREISAAVMSSLLIPLRLKPDNTQLFFAINIDRERGSAIELTIEEVFPWATPWRGTNVVIRPLSHALAVRAAVALKDRSDTIIRVGFGYD